MCEQVVCEQVVCVSKLCVCVCKLCVRRREDGRWADGRIQNQKQEPHTKMWGTIHVIKCHACHTKWKVDVTKCHACHAKRRGVTAPPGNQARHQSQPSAISATPATQSEGGCHQVPRLPRKTPRRHSAAWEPSATPEPTQCHKRHACHAK